MFHWICPECGREIAPTIRECPVCDPVAASVETALVGEVEAPARAGQEVSAPGMSVGTLAAVTPVDPKPDQPVALLDTATAVVASVHNGLPPNIAAPSLAKTAPPALPDSKSPALAVSASTVLPDTAPPALADNPFPALADKASRALPDTATPALADSTSPAQAYSAPPQPAGTATFALAERLVSASVLASRSSRSVAEQDALDALDDALLPQFGFASAGSDPLDHLSKMLDSMRDQTASEPPPSHDSLPLPMSPASVMPASLRAFIEELRPAGAEPRIPGTPKEQRQTPPEPPLLMNSIPLPLRPSQQALAPPAGAKLLAMPVQPQDAIRPSTRSLDLAPPLAPLGDYSPLAGHPLRPAIPRVRLLKKECGPRTTLPGPMLTRRLVKFLDRELGSIPPSFLQVKKRLIPGWMATALILGTLLGAGFTGVISVVRPAAEARLSASAPTVSEAATAASGSEVASAGASPLAKAIEVTGFRMQMDPAKKSEIQYLVVNHTPARFSGVTVYVTLYAADAKAGQPPLGKFQFTAPNLAPFQAKDMTSAIESVTRPASLPNWQDLRASVEIGE